MIGQGDEDSDGEAAADRTDVDAPLDEATTPPMDFLGHRATISE